jgi:conjugative relaxase-like TrwC/TraI family protein
MLSIAGPFKATEKSLEYYVCYYTEQMKDQGVWFGDAAEKLTLGEQVTAAQFRLLLRGFHPDGTPLVQNAGDENRQAFWDCTFSAPKSVSVLWAILPKEQQQLVLAAQLKAVKIALGWLERQTGLSRRGKGGSRLEEVGLAFALFQDYVSREIDPQLHTQCVLLNLGTRSDGTVGALWTEKMFDMKMEAGALYRVALADELRRSLGVRIEPDRFGFALSDVPEALCKHFSKRRKQIEDELERDGDYSAVAAKEAAIKTRGPSKKFEFDVLFEAWRRVGREFGWDQ